MAGGNRKGRSKKVVVNFTEEEKKKLASLVEMHPQLWNLADPLYKRPDAHPSAWEKISKEMNYTTDECKKGWKSLKDGLRYRKNPKQIKGKSGDSAAEDDSDAENITQPDSEVMSWPFWECMKFVAVQKTNRTTISSADAESTEQENVQESAKQNEATADNDNSQVDISTPKISENSGNVQKQSNYDYVVKRKRNRTEDSTEKLASGIADLIKMRKDGNGMPAKVESLTYHSMYANLDRMLKQLPSVVVEELNMQYVNLAYDAIKRQQNIIIVEENQ